MDKAEHGRVFKPPRVPRSISLVNDVVKVNTLAKKRMIHKAAETTSELMVMAPPQAKLQIKTELTEKVRMDKISYVLLNSAFRSFSAILIADEKKPKGFT
jgi:putative heme degradation protein